MQAALAGSGSGVGESTDLDGYRLSIRVARDGEWRISGRLASRRAPVQAQRHAAFWAERDLRLQFQLLVRVQELEPVALPDGRQDQRAFDQCELVADTDVRAASDGEILERVPAALGVLGKAIGIEVLRILPEFGVTMHGVEARDQYPVRRNAVPADLEWLGGGSHQEIGGRVEPQCLLEDHPGIRQTLQIIESGRSTAQDRIDLRVETRRDLRLARQVIPHIGERQGRGVVPGKIEREHLGADLLVG